MRIGSNTAAVRHHVRLLVLACVVVLVAPALAGAAAPAKFWNGKAAVTRPTSVGYTGDGTGFLSKLRWTSFGGATAKATGIDNANKCKPSCAGGTFVKHPATATLSRPITCKGKRVYSSVVIKVTGASELSGRWPLYTSCGG